jgi:hypothetical protein
LVSLALAALLGWRRVGAWLRRRSARLVQEREAACAQEDAVIALLEVYVSGRGTGHTEAEVSAHRTTNRLRINEALERLKACRQARDAA